MQEILLFIFTFIFTYVCYRIFVVSKTKKKKAKNLEYKELTEIMYLIKRYKLDIEKVDYNQLLNIVAFVSSLDITLVVTLASLFKSLILTVFVVVVGVILVTLVSYHLVYKFYLKKGMIKNE